MNHRIVFLDRATIAPSGVRAPGFAHELIVHVGRRRRVAERLAGGDDRHH